jgi:hypothetical protein
MAILGKKQEETEFNLDDLIKEQNTKPCNIVAGIYGFDDTAKSGIAFCVRTKEDIEKGRDLFVIDLDQSAIPIKKFWDNDPHIICLNPTVLYDSGNRKGERDPEKTIENTRNIIRAIKKRDPDKVAGIIFDGCDILLKIAGEFMLEDSLGLDVYSSGKSLGEASRKGEIRRTDWGIRDKKYNTVIDLLKYCPFPVILITHLKNKMEMRTNEDTGQRELQTVGTIIDWGNYTRNQMYQRILCEKIEEGKHIVWQATIEKSKSNPSLTGRKIITMTKENDSDIIKWKGFDWNIFR